MCTHEDFINKVADCSVAYAGPGYRDLRTKLKLSYGIGAVKGARGLTAHNAWHDCEGEKLAHVEIAARHEESPVQLAGTTIHEMAHVLAGPDAGHGPEWKEACRKLGLVDVKAAGTEYTPDNFDSPLLKILEKIETPSDGTPNWLDDQGEPIGAAPRPCSQGIGTRGGTSRGTGSGSRMLKAVCPNCGYTIRLTRKWALRGLPTCTPCTVDASAPIFFVED